MTFLHTVFFCTSGAEKKVTGRKGEKRRHVSSSDDDFDGKEAERTVEQTPNSDQTESFEVDSTKAQDSSPPKETGPGNISSEIDNERGNSNCQVGETENDIQGSTVFYYNVLLGVHYNQFLIIAK